MARLFITLYFLLHALFATGQYAEESLAQYLNEVKSVTQANSSIWDLDLYAPILLVDPDTRQIFANEADQNQQLTKSKELYIGELSKTINVANTALEWGGKRWAMIMLPLPEDRHQRLQLITHELFHQAQPQLNFSLDNPSNNHLDKKEARIYLKLELEALRSAILSNALSEIKTHVTNALIFRQARNLLYPQSDSTEQLLELNEGFAEYTGLMMSERSDEQTKNYLETSLNEFLKNKTFVRSFAYQSLPMYGYLLSKVKADWNKDISSDTNLTNYMVKTFGIELPKDANTSASNISSLYNGQMISAFEIERDNQNKEMLTKQMEKFVHQSHFDLAFEKMNVFFNPSNLIALDEFGTVYPTIRVTDNWGILEVENGALMAPNWNKITITPPTQTNKGIIIGDGWTLELNTELYSIEQEPSTGNYFLNRIEL